MRILGHGIGVRYGDSSILEDIDVSIEPGQVLGLIGPNGAGKSTLLKVLAGLAAPDTGTIGYHAESGPVTNSRTLARHVAYLAQSPAVHWPLPVQAIVELGRLPHQGLWRTTGPEETLIVRRALERTDTFELRHRTVGTLSGGERMRALIARLLAVEADVLLADEPVAALDPYHQLQVMDIFTAEAARGRAVVVVLHDLALAARCCDRLLLLHEGRVAAEGLPRDVLTEATVADVYRVQSISGEHDGRLYLLPWARENVGA